MDKEVFSVDKKYVGNYKDRNNARENTLLESTMNFVGYFMALGDDQATAEVKVSQVSSDVAAYIYVYTLGNPTPLFDAINAIDDTVLTFMDATAKAYLIGELTES